MLQLDHIGIDARDAQASAQYLAEILGIAAATPEALLNQNMNQAIAAIRGVRRIGSGTEPYLR